MRYASDCTDDEWAVVRAFLKRTSRVGRPRKHKARTLWDAIRYIAAAGCQWAQLQKISLLRSLSTAATHRRNLGLFR
ncbi:transposase [Sphingomonas sp. CFBP 8760]|nr:transposase [Sphingomonas sp. CFBP 8760]